MTQQKTQGKTWEIVSEVPSQSNPSKRYTVKTDGEIVACSCPAFRFQKAPLAQRSCKHIVALRKAVA